MVVGLMYKRQTSSAMKTKNQTITNQTMTMLLKSANHTIEQKPLSKYPPPPPPTYFYVDSEKIG